MDRFLNYFFRAIHSRYDIEKPAAKRLIRRKLNLINQLKAEISDLKEQQAKQARFLKTLAAEYNLLGKECETEGMEQAAIANYKKALELWPDFPEAKRRLKKLSRS